MKRSTGTPAGAELRSAKRRDETDAFRCPVCGQGGMTAFWAIRDLPVKCNALCSTRSEALAVPRADIDLAICRSCGYIHNTSFDAARMAYDPAYENALHFSPHFRAYANDLARRIIDTYDLHGKDILEIACGDGYFLRLLCKLGSNRGVGFDPSYTDRSSDEDTDTNVSIIRDYYGEKYADRKADLICCRHALEHMPDPVAFLSTIRQMIGDRHDTVVFFEVPNAMFILRDLSVWDIIYEHCCYFTIPSLVQCFRRAGFEVDDVRETYDGQFLTITARPTVEGKQTDATEELSTGDVVDAAQAFADRFSQKLDTWARQFETLAASGRKVVLWGGGSKGITILNMLRGVGGTDCIGYVVDINPRKQDMWVPGTGHRIVGPGIVKIHPPDTIVVMNALYVNEIRAMMEQVDVSVELVTA